MSTISYLASLVNQVIGRLNAIESNAKKVDELPHQTILEPTSKLPVSRSGVSEHITIQQIISSIQNSNYNQLLSVGTITVVATDIIVESGVSGQINSAIYSTSTDTTIPITLCASGFNRKDILVLTTSNTVIAISGEETDGSIVLAPSVPIDTVYITEFDVNDSAIGSPIDPILGSQFKKKSEALGYGDPDLSGTNAVIQLRPEGNSRYAFSNASLISIDGFGLSLITGVPTAETPYDGKDLFIENTGTTPFTLLHDGPGTASSKFFFTDEQNLTIPAGEKVWLKYGSTTCELIFKSWQNESESGYKVIASNFNNSSIVTGTTSPTIIETYTIPANTFTAGDRIIFTCRIFKLVSTGQTQHSHFIGSGIEGAFGIFNSGTGYTYSQIKKDFTIKSSSITQGIGLNVNTNTSDVNQNVGSVNNINKNINWEIDQPLQIRIVNELSTDQSYVSFWELSRIRP